ncbi:metallophosphoesterase [Pendulispora albinea]|uniref:Metallophosphoesterase n=1 Tax=Pendulispora albinea TaxID=2741071 RepID=A0ABZ2LUC6_9BACT
MKLTDGETIVPTHTVAPSMETPSSKDPSAREQRLASGYGEFTTGPGEPVLDRTLDDMPPPLIPMGAKRTRLVRFAHLADFQIADDESPTRLAALDGPPPAEAAFRPQEGHGCRMTNAVVRTVNRIHKDLPLDFVLLGGDNSDSAQKNELEWVLALMDGGSRLACDSGDRDDPVPGPNNDGKDPFAPEGLDVPWYWVTGNHDILIQGNFVVDATSIEQSKGTLASGGTRDYRQPGSPITTDSIVPDGNRAALSRTSVIDRVVIDRGKAGLLPAHGLGAYAKEKKKAFYTSDFGDSGVRLIVLDTAAETGGSEGVLRKSDLEGFVKPALADAKAEKKFVILASHHAAASFSDGGGFGGTKQPDTVSTQEWENLLTSNPHVIAHFAAHSHVHRVRPVSSIVPGTSAYWEITTSAIADYPHEFRTVEIADEGNDYLSITSVAADFSTEDDPVALTGRKLGILDYTSHGVGSGQGTAKDRNVKLWIKKPKL